MENLVEKVINGVTYLVDKDGKLCYVKEEKTSENCQMDEFVLELDIKTNGETFDCWLSDDIGGSGISIKRTDKKDFLLAISSYIESYLTNE